MGSGLFFWRPLGALFNLLPRSLFLHCRSEADSVAAGKGRRAGAGFRVGTEQGRPHYPFLGLFTSSRKTSSQASEPEEFTSVSGTFFAGKGKARVAGEKKKSPVSVALAIAAPPLRDTDMHTVEGRQKVLVGVNSSER